MKATPFPQGGGFVFHPFKENQFFDKEIEMEKLLTYFSNGIGSKTLQTVGAEVETQFVDEVGFAVSKATSQKMLCLMAERGWKINSRKGGLITSLSDRQGNQINYELGTHNIEISTVPSTVEKIIGVMNDCLGQLYSAGSACGAEPYSAPILLDDEDLLVIPDERDAIWLELDGRAVLAPLARTSAVQFTISVALEDAVPTLNKLGTNVDLFLNDYPQDAIWKRYIKESSAGYRPDRYGGPLMFESLEGYCRELARHGVVSGTRLVPYEQMRDLDISLFLRSVWWYFRLRRYGADLCIEVRPIPRRRDEEFQKQLSNVLQIVES